MKKFFINDSFLTVVFIQKTEYKYDLSKELTNEQLADLLINGNTAYHKTVSQCHPIFLALREKLLKQGYIDEMRSWSRDNDFRVLIPFMINGHLFEKNTRFPTALEIGYRIKHDRSVQ